MNLCSDSHDEVCFEGKTCPVCYALKHQAEVTKIKELEIDDLCDRVYELQKELQEKKAELADVLGPCIQAANGLRKE